MATWKKVIVSGSNAELNQLNVGTNQQISSSVASTFLSGSFSGSFNGDGSNLTNINATVLRSGFITASVSTGNNRFVVQSGSTNVFTLNQSYGVSLFNSTAANTANGTGSLALGIATNALGLGSLANGSGAAAEGDYSHAEGQITRAVGVASHAEGDRTTAVGNFSHAEGSGSVTLGIYSHAEGLGTIASGSGQLVIGQYNTQNNATASAFIIGNGTDDTNRSDLAVFTSRSITFNAPLVGTQITGAFSGNGAGLTGLRTNFISTGSVSASVDNTNVAGGFRFRVNEGATSYFTVFNTGGVTTGIGTGVNTSGGKVYNRAEGSASYASGSYSVAQGIGTVTNNNTDGQFALGNWNVNTPDALVVIGNGTDANNRSNLATFSTASIVFNRPVTGSVFSGSFVGDGSSLTGVASTLNFSGSFGSGSVNLSSSVFIISGSNNQIQTTASGNTLTIKLADNVTIPNNLIVTNNLTVQGTASFQQTTNLEVADRFVLFASGSNIAGDGGIVVQQGIQNVGELFGYENSVNRWGFTSSFNAAGPSFTAAAFVTTTEVGTAAPTAAPVYGGSTNGLGNIYVRSTTEEIFIYS